jgi:sec-independent protein translocase protein TatA
MFEGLFQPMHLLVIFVIAMLIFGPKKLADLGKGLGQGIREFKDAVKDGDHQSTSTPVVNDKEKDKTNIA